MFKHVLRLLNLLLQLPPDGLHLCLQGPFSWSLCLLEGMGLLIFKALENVDLPIVMGSTIVIATIFVLVNIVVDVLYAVLDPRVNLSC